MFDDLVESSVVKKKTNTGWAVVLSTIVQVCVLVVLILIPLIYTQALPKAMLTTLLIAPPPPPPPPPPPAEAPKVIKPVARLIQQGKLTQPRAIPKQVAVFKEAELPPEAPVAAGGVLGGVDSGLLGGLGAGPAVAAPPPPPPPKQTQRIKLGGQVVAAKLLAQPQPVYPPLARQARIQGNVVLHAIIDKDGRVGELQVISGHPLLVQSALEAVKNWRYQPTQLNGEPVEVDTTITVSFVLGG
ncbi:MAG TPA: energy transducer TonB [Candidatus Acidoferrales bacterium]|jgi:protein TonB|nr:energy transducer TonB [Candidatus Acidoferrales bacterium]